MKKTYLENLGTRNIPMLNQNLLLTQGRKIKNKFPVQNKVTKISFLELFCDVLNGKQFLQLK